MSNAPESGQARIVVRGLAVWFVVMIAEIAHGVLRGMLLVPVIGEFRSNQVGVLSGSVIIVLIAWLTVRWIGATSPFGLMLVGLIWLAFTVAFEFLFGRFVMGLSWERLLEGYNLLHGGLMPLGLLLLLFSPMIAWKLRARH